MNYSERIKLHSEGLNDREAADKLGLKKNCFAKWRIRNGLPANQTGIRKHDHTNRPDWEIENMREFEKLLLAVDDEAREVGRRLTESGITDVMNYYREGYNAG